MRAVGASRRVLAILVLLGGTLNGWARAQTTPTAEGTGTPAGATNPAPEGATSDFAGPGSAASNPAVTPNLNPAEPEVPAPTPFLLMKALGIPDDSPLRIYGWVQNSFTGNTNGTPASGNNFALFPNHLAN